jgi:predicted O-linked N-acetylglucosamine transferase (SPINDLY family)
MQHHEIAALAHEAQFHLKTGNLWEARVLYDQICQASKENAEAWMMLGAINGELGKHDAAVSCLKTAIGLRPDFPQAHYNLGNVLRMQGNFQDAFTHLERAVNLETGYAEAWQMLGGLHLQMGRMEQARACCQRALDLRPDSPDAHVKLGIVFSRSGMDHEAIVSFTRATELEPGSVQAWHLLSRVYEGMKRHQEAETCARRTLSLKADIHEAHILLANSLRAQNRLDEAIESYRAALRIKPDMADVHYELGNLLMQRGEPAIAAASFRKAVELKPDFTGALNKLGLALHETRDFAGAIDAYRKVLEINPGSPGTYSNLGLSWHFLGNLWEAEICFREATRLRPEVPGAWSNLAGTLNAQRKYDEAINAYRRALELKPDYADVRSNMLLCLNYTSSYGPEAVLEEHKAWEKTHVPKVPRVLSYRNPPEPGRRIRIGYVSPDFRSHSVSFFIEPVLKHHDRDAFEVVCYAEVRNPDGITQRLRGYDLGWHNTCGMTDASVAKTIQDDGIDILVDLAGHTGFSRLGVFACKPAPVQVCYLGYPNTTGLSTIDYRLTDGWADPPGAADAFYTEKLFRLPHGFLCYQPEPGVPPVAPLPALNAGYVTFGSFNILPKMTPAVVALWSAILRELPRSRLVLKNNSVADAAIRDHVYEEFAAHGIARERIDLLGRLPRMDEHMAIYHQIDVALDPFPYNGTTTTCEALWMGVPVVTLAGQSHAGRVGVSILNQIDLKECIAANQDEYLAIATRLAGNLDELAKLRNGLRERMMMSSLCDATGFTRMIEGAYREMWREWCTMPVQYHS